MSRGVQKFDQASVKLIDTDVKIVVISHDSGQFGLVVDEILDTTAIVVKPLPAFYKRLEIFSGATIMGDGSVALILDVAGLSSVRKISAGSGRRVPDALLAAEKLKFDTQELLSFSLKNDGHFAIPLCLVNRLEEFSVSDVEYSGPQRLVQYRGSILPLVSLSEMLNISASPKEAAHDEEKKISVIVISKRNRSFGFEVEQIHDVYKTQNEIESLVRETRGILGTAVIENNVFTVIDVLSLIDELVGPTDSLQMAQSGESANTNPRPFAGLNVLLAEDTSFFARQVIKALTSFGINVTHAQDGAKALKILENDKQNKYNLLVSDIEMPNLDGFSLAQKVRADGRWANFPMIALTTRFREADQARGKAVGFNRYLEKLKTDVLMDAIREVVNLEKI